MSVETAEPNATICKLTRGGGGGGVTDACAVCKILHVIESYAHGVQVAHSVADDLNIYYEQFPCVGTPKFPSRK